MKLLGSSKSKITVPHLAITEVILFHCNFVNNDHQQDSKFLFIFVLNKLFGQLLHISPKSFILLKTFNSEFSYMKLWFTDQNSKPLVIN